MNFPRLSGSWVDDLYAISHIEAEEEKARNKARQRIPGYRGAAM